MSRGIAFFDFDGTITTHDTMLEFIKFSRGTFSFYAGFLLYSPYLVGYKLKLIPRQTAKEKVLAHFFRNQPAAAFEEQCALFAKTRIPALIRPQALVEIERLKAEGAQVVIVSASPENWIRFWTDSLQLQLIATRLEVQDGRLTGRLLGKNCHGAEKVRRINEHYTLSDYQKIYAYGDTSGDKPMLRLATHPAYKPFR